MVKDQVEKKKEIKIIKVVKPKIKVIGEKDSGLEEDVKDLDDAGKAEADLNVCQLNSYNLQFAQHWFNQCAIQYYKRFAEK